MNDHVTQPEKTLSVARRHLELLFGEAEAGQAARMLETALEIERRLEVLHEPMRLKVLEALNAHFNPSEER